MKSNRSHHGRLYGAAILALALGGAGLAGCHRGAEPGNQADAQAGAQAGAQA
ncbi:MAG: hypothetical protein JWO25_588, partial [Alphaproteobacteria bacterium]|nr:hypothetical protein [Alphaproteobacteria bacterium]